MTKKDKRRSRTSLIAAALVALAVWLGWCGRGYFLGGGDPGLGVEKQEPRPATADATRARCLLRVDAQGITIAGDRVDLPTAIARCQPAGEAELTVTGDARFGTVDELRADLEHAGIRVFEAKR